MTLPSPDEINRQEYYSDYFIRTPTFDLTPIEKPDMSPFLIHMTGKDEIVSILEGEEGICEPGEGCLLAVAPEYSNGNMSFDAKVVCFTESPTFAIDFFRHRRVERWERDQRFGIGFSKMALAARGVRPVIYLQDSIVTSIISLFFRNGERIESLREEEEEEGLDRPTRRRLRELEEVNSILESMYPLLFPLGESSRYQGFMWEREWRFFGADEFIFNYQDIEIICCPRDEEPEIREILGHYADDIVFVRTWDEYSDVTQYLESQQEIWDERNARIAQTARQSVRRRQLKTLLKERTRTLRSLQSYIQFIGQIQRDLTVAQGSEATLRQEIQQLQQDLQQMEEESS